MNPLEAPRPLSESVIWRLQREFYAAEGPGAWTRREIPAWITSNPFFSSGLASVVLGFLRDLAASGTPPAGPITLLELASGSGQFAYHFLRRLAGLRRSVPALEKLPLRYVLSDFTDSNLRGWESQERFRPFLEDGSVDFAVFDLERDRGVRLARSGERLDGGPLVVVANYAFDSTLQDCFRVRAGRLYADLVRTMVPDEAPSDPSAPGQLQRITALEHEPQVVTGAYYGDPRLDAILESYRRSLDDTVFLFPIGALRAVATLMEVARGRLLLLCGDKGVSREEDLRGRGEPAMVRHRGCFSFSVNLHAIGRYFEECGGFALHTDQPRPRLQVSAFLSGFDPAALVETRQAFRDLTSGFGPGDFHTLAVALCEQKPPQTLDVMLSVLKLAAFDAEVLYSYREALVAAARVARPAQKEELRRALARVGEEFYPLHKDVPFELARISFAMSEAEDALRYCGESLRLFGESARTLVMQGYCFAMLGRAEEAVRAARRALELDPVFTPATELLERLGGPPTDIPS